MNSTEVIQSSKRLNSKENCNPAVQDFHITVLADIIDKLDIMNKKLDKFDNVQLFNGPRNNIPLSRPRSSFEQEIYEGNKKIGVLAKEFEEQKKKTFAKEAGRISKFIITVVLPIAMLISIIINIVGYINNRSDFARSDKLQKTIEQTEKNH
jgi:hypothetical protein